ncbi:hypothetical protein KUM39_09875 [Streptomyces sp. J2-1]|uniref:hypothetical protein n=1 Tax=Streptomyces corallincola TaxID=2851888 RepID=UPI001C38CDCA|nr:hypothetical protein [Streptomyces corallincola]MBV2354668.1 hypothetical protein [Streptomyces corallincola]
MTTPDAFNYGAHERSDNYWARVMTPEYQAQKRARQEQEKLEAERAEEQQRAEWQRQAVMNHAGPAIMDIVQQYLGQNRPAVASAVKAQFLKRLPGSTEVEFENALAVLQQTGHIHKLTSDTQGYMGERTYHLYTNPLEG